MTTTEHLQLIKSECERLLALSEKRTQGAWKIHHIPNRYFSDDIYEIHHGNDGECISELTHRKEDSEFIASCAGRAEAGWRSTIAAIQSIWRRGAEDGRESNAILTAWPIELLTNQTHE